MKNRWEKENLIIIIANSISRSEVLKKLGLRAAGNNGLTLRKYIKLYDLDTSHFKKNWETMARLSKENAIPLEKILIKDSTYQRGHLKIRLYNSGFKERKCEKCGQGENWNGEKISLILDHINGIYNDNRIENLREADKSKNAGNQKIIKKSRSGIKGVRIKNNKIYSIIGYRGKRYFLGYFKTTEEAKNAYDKKAKELFGEYARI